MEVVELNHPLVSHKLTILRDKKTGTKEFREIIGELSMMLCYEAMKDAELDEKEIETPICKMKGKTLNEDKYAFVPILRAGTGMLDGLIKVMPNAKIGHIGMYRNEETLKPVRYYFKTPKDLDKREQEIIILRYYKEKTQTEVAKILGITQVQVSRIEKRILSSMRTKLMV